VVGSRMVLTFLYQNSVHFADLWCRNFDVLLMTFLTLCETINRRIFTIRSQRLYAASQYWAILIRKAA